MTQLRADFDDKVKSDLETLTHYIKDSKDRYASLLTRVDDAVADVPEWKPSMEAFTHLRFENAVAHTNSIAQHYRSAYA